MNVAMTPAAADVQRMPATAPADGTPRILHVLDHSLPLHSGYTFRTRAIIRAQQALGWQVAGLTGVRHNGAGNDGELVDGIRFFRTPMPSPSPSPIAEWRETRALRARLGQLIRDWQPDLIHAHSPVLNAMGAIPAARAAGVPIIYEIRAFWEDAAVGNETGREGSLRYRATRWLETRAVRQVDAVAVICEGLRRELIDTRGIPADKIMVSPNGVDMDMFGDPPPRDDALGADLGLDGKDVIGFIGSFYPYEGLDVLLDAMPRLVAARPALHLLLVGGGPRDAELRAQAAVLACADRIHFTGRVSHDQVDRYYSLMDVLVFPRKALRVTELVTPLKPLEAMAQRKLVAASAVGGHRELIRDGDTGTLFPPDDPAALADAVAAIFARRDTWDAQKDRARRFVETERNWSSNISRYIPVYQKLLGRKLAP